MVSLSNIGGLAAGGAVVSIVIHGIDNFSSTFNKANTGMKLLGTTAKIGALAFLGAGIAIAGLGVAAVKTASSFESAFAGVRKTVDLSEEGFAALEQKFKDISKVTPITFQELSRIGELAGQLGVSGVDNLSKFTKTIADISVTTNLTAEQAATDFARISNVMQEPLENVDRMGATIVDLGNNFATTEAEISAFAQRIAGAGSVVGLSTNQILSIGAALSSIGIEAEAGGTAVQTALLQINKSIVMGDDKMQIFAETAGMSSEQFKQAWETDAAGAFNSFIQGLSTQGDQAAITLDNVGLGGIRTSRAFLGLANSGDLLTKALETGSKAWEENSALEEEASKRYKTFASQIQILKNTFTSLIEPLGQQLIPVILDIAKIFSEDILPAIEPLIPVIGDFLVGALQRLAPYIPQIVDNLMRFVEFSMRLFEVLMPLMDPLMELGFVIFDQIMNILSELLPSLEMLVPVFVDLIKQITPIIPPLATLLAMFIKIGVEILKGIIPAINFLMPIFEALIFFFNQGIDAITTLVGWIVKLVEWLNKINLGLLEKAGSIIGGVGKFAGKIIGVNDAIIRPNGDIIKTHPNDTLIATKNPEGFGTGITFIVQGDLIGLDADDISRRLVSELNNKMSL